MIVKQKDNKFIVCYEGIRVEADSEEKARAILLMKLRKKQLENIRTKRKVKKNAYRTN